MAMPAPSPRPLQPPFGSMQEPGTPSPLRAGAPLQHPQGQGKERERTESSAVPSASLLLPLEITQKKETCQKTH